MERDGQHPFGPDHGLTPDPFGLRARAEEAERALRARAATMRIEIDAIDRVHAAAGADDGAWVRRIRVTNLGQLPREDLTLSVRLGRDRAAGFVRRLDLLEPGASWIVEDVALELDPTRRMRREHRERLELEVALELPDGLLASERRAIELLAWNEWSGLGSAPEGTAAFVLPDDPALGPLADEVLERVGTDHPSSEQALLAAVWDTVAEREPTLVAAPEDALSSGATVRGPERVLAAGVGTALDLALLGAGLLERLGLCPLLLFTDDRVLLGLWLEGTGFHEPLIEDPQRVAKRLRAELIAAVDPTGWTTRPPLDVDAARAEAARALEDLDRFACAVDVAAARRSGVVPFSSDGRALPASTPGSAPDARPARPSAPGETPNAPTGARTTDAVDDRLESWKRRLLDLSLHNRFLAFRETRKTLALEAYPPAALERLLAEGRALDLLPAGSGGASEAGAPETRARETLELELEAGRLRASAPPADFEARLTEIRRAARASLEESGANTLFLASAFLVWREPDRPERALRAPLLLRPLELERLRGGRGWRVRAAADEPRANEALVEKLGAEHDLDPAPFVELPFVDGVVDLERWLIAWRRAVVDRPGWDVVEDLRLGLFSFTKFLMWRDLDSRRADLTRARVSRFLIERPDEPFETEPPELAPEPPSARHLVLDADASQERAIQDALAGRSFVLEGPPGTGKSQTIANLIACALADGQRVLFVAEKRAALEVVQRRLEAIGLGPYCLELHSNKASKRAVVEQLGRALETRPEAPPEDLEARGIELDALTAELDRHAERINRPQTDGRTLYEALARSLELGGVPRAPLEVAEPLALTAVDRDDLLARCASLARAASLAEPGPDHPLTAVRRTELGPADRRRIDGALPPLASAVGDLLTALGPLASTLGRPALSRGDRASLDGVRELANLWSESPSTTPPLLRVEDFAALEAGAAATLERAREQLRMRRAVLERWSDGLLESDLAALQDEVEALRRRHPLLRWLAVRRLRARLAPLTRGGSAPGLEQLARELRDARTSLAVRSELERAPLTRPLGPDWYADEARIEAAALALDRAAAVRSVAATLAPEAESRARLLDVLADAVERGDPELRDRLRGAADALESFDAALEGAAGALDLDLRLLSGDDGRAPLLDQLAALWEAVEGWGARLRDWCLWQAARAAALEGPLAPLVPLLEGGTLEPGQVVEAAEASLLEAWIEAAIDAEPDLRRFHGLRHAERIERFRSLDSEWLEHTRRAVVARLDAAVPRPGTSTAEGSELGLLLRELRKKRGHLPVRRLLERLPTLLPRIAPCLLMSPLSTAQFLDASTTDFDLVVFDEASQIPAWDGVGAMARGRAVVVVGDSKQLPPTSFFQNVVDDEDPDEDDLEELESLLDECVASGLPRRTLDWHYRSRHESLIAFSNAHYYANRLETFPAPPDGRDALGLEWHHVPDGVYDRARSRTNPVEAQALVDRVLAILEGPDPTPSVGVVTFSQAQQALVEELLERALAQRPELEARIGGETNEPLFVKNLENVQGDERDVILLGVGYGPDANGRFAMHFGPLNRRGGERRLNVAVTRARRRLVACSSFRPEQIDLRRTDAVGVRHLQSFLHFAAARLPHLAVDSGDGLDPAAPSDRGVDALARRLARALEERGARVDRRVGASRFRIDLVVERGGVRLGVLLDGEGYGRTESARDRDRIRLSVLEGLGWTLAHAWGLDVWSDLEGSVARIEHALTKAAPTRPADGGERGGAGSDPGPGGDEPAPEAAPRASALEPAGPPIDPERAFDDDERPVPGEAATDRNDAEQDHGTSHIDRPSADQPSADQPSADQPSADQPSVDQPSAYQTSADASRADPPGLDDAAPNDSGGPGQYVPARLASRARRKRHFHSESEDERLALALCQVVDAEGPIQEQLALRRVVGAWGFARVTAKLLERVRAATVAIPDAQRPRLVDGFLWPPGGEPGVHRGFRGVDSRGRAAREPDELPLEEVANAARHVLDHNLALGRGDLVREVARLFGFARGGKRIAERVDAGLERLAARGGCRLEGDRVLG